MVVLLGTRSRGFRHCEFGVCCVVDGGLVVWSGEQKNAEKKNATRNFGGAESSGFGVGYSGLDCLEFSVQCTGERVKWRLWLVQGGTRKIDCAGD